MLVEPPQVFTKPQEIAEVRYADKKLPSDNPAMPKKFQKELDEALRQSHQPPPSKPWIRKEPKPVFVNKVPTKWYFDALPIKSMKLPRGWWEYQRREYALGGGGEIYNKTFIAKNYPPAELSFSCPGVYPRDDTNLKKLLKEPAHILSLAELRSIEDREFYTNAQTEEIDGKKVIAIWGKREDDNLVVYKILFNQFPTRPESPMEAEIEFTAPPAQYKRHIGEVKESFKTIKWKTAEPKDECQD